MSSNKAAGSEIPLKFLKESDFSFHFLTNCINEAIKNKNFPDSLKLSNTLYSHGSNLPLILNNLEHNMRNLLYWFKTNSLKTNPVKFRFMILGKKKRLKYSLKIGSIIIKDSDEVELPGINIDIALNFKKHIKNLCCAAQYKLHALRWIRNYLTLDKPILLGNAFIDSQFNNARLIWTFCHKGTFLKMQKIHYKSFISLTPLMMIYCN